MRILFFILFLLSYLTAFNFEISNSTIANGKTAIIIFDKDENIQLDKLVLDKKEYKIFKHPSQKDKMYALLPVSYYQKPKNQKVEVIYTENNKKLSKILFFKFIDGKYAQEKIEVQKSKVNPKSAVIQKRTAQEYAQAMKIYRTITPENYGSGKYIVPMESKITSSFGKARIYNSTLKGYHSGTDFRAKIGTPVIAINSGKVVLAKERFYSGNSIIIDHGQGVYSCYFHLSEFKVKEGEMVKKSQLIALSGDTGRITGPHLHFGVRVNGLQVDPLQLIALLNQNLY